jgi:hypothetical protein
MATGGGSEGRHFSGSTEACLKVNIEMNEFHDDVNIISLRYF